MEKRNEVAAGITRCCKCGALACQVDHGKPYCIDHEGQPDEKRAEAKEPRLKNAADHLTSAE